MPSDRSISRSPSQPVSPARRNFWAANTAPATATGRSSPPSRTKNSQTLASQVSGLSDAATKLVDTADGAGREQPLPLARVLGLAVQGDPAQAAAVQDVARPLGGVGDLLHVDPADAVEHVLELERQDRAQLLAGAGVDLAQVQAAG